VPDGEWRGGKMLLCALRTHLLLSILS